MSMPAKRGTSQGWIPGIFNDFFGYDWMLRHNTTAPAINVFECENKYSVDVAAPGMTKEDFSIHINSENDLVICMEKNCCKNHNGEQCGCNDKEAVQQPEKSEEEKKGRYLRREFSYTKFQQTLIMPDNANTSKIAAKVSDGVLHIEIPKKSTAEASNVSRRIAIE